MMLDPFPRDCHPKGKVTGHTQSAVQLSEGLNGTLTKLCFKQSTLLVYIRCIQLLCIMLQLAHEMITVGSSLKNLTDFASRGCSSTSELMQ